MSEKSGIEIIEAERRRQIEKEGWDSQHDSEHDNYELAKAAICYARQATSEGMCLCQDRCPNDWPFELSSWKPEPRIKGLPSPMIEEKDALKMLAKAGALIAAQIDVILNRPILSDKEE